MKILVLALSTAVLVSGCVETSKPVATARPANRVMETKIPNPFIMAGEVGPGMIAAGEMRSDGIAVQTVFAGRAAGIVAFCSGKAHSVSMSSGFTSGEWQTCKDLGGSWSAFTTRKGAITYVKHTLAEILLKKATNTFGG